MSGVNLKRLGITWLHRTMNWPSERDSTNSWLRGPCDRWATRSPPSTRTSTETTTYRLVTRVLLDIQYLERTLTDARLRPRRHPRNPSIVVGERGKTRHSGPDGPVHGRCRLDATTGTTAAGACGYSTMAPRPTRHDCRRHARECSGRRGRSHRLQAGRFPNEIYESRLRRNCHHDWQPPMGTPQEHGRLVETGWSELECA